MITKVDAYTIPFYEFNCPEDLVDRMIEYVKTLDYRENLSNSVQIGLIKDLELIDWFNKCLDELSIELFGETDFRLRVIQSWATRCQFTELHQAHTHRNSVFSGILYLSTHSKQGSTFFHLPSPWHYFEHNKFLNLNHKKPKEHTYDYPSVKGKMIVFPSNLMHGSRTNIQRSNRYIIGFNSFFEGNLGDLIPLTTLELSTKYV